MCFTLVFTVFGLITAAASVQGAHWAICTNNTNGTGGTKVKVTRDCCASAREHGSTAFNENQKECEDALGLDNGINLGRFVQCCDSRGSGRDGK
ncbi:hypothetical protein NDA18_000248 [Ustilago nuda]|nr:hypothetical protein NDA18_000248 [Ustilago nuda]